LPQRAREAAEAEPSRPCTVRHRIYPPRAGPQIETAWLEPYPDAAIEGIPDTGPGPEARYELRESVQLAFVVAIQQLAARQRAVLLRRDVLGWSGAETAEHRGR